ncbi:unnamed protein product [Darwinula stevensoni]|uniref:triacylglycerol lipase n=2 Tax=Darwinula stevensoni TaxID=69355 RepID=A0A7R9A4Y9_9CRUS|nr:unnamed protein product [Darwinula stevensoni]CAG0885278.1 unnamed protein product [Darwinula stevensoni]
MNVSFAGCGFLGIYHVGVASCFKKYAPNLFVDKTAGASAGAIAACCLLCNSPLGQITSDVIRVASQARAKTLGPFNPTFNITKILRSGLEEILPENCHEIVNGKLHVSLTRVYDRRNVIISHFESKEDLIQALLCSAFIPIFSGWVPLKLRGVRYIDGCFSNNIPLLDEHTITVSPFCGETDICPRDPSASLLQINLANTSIELSRENLYRMARILFPPEPEILSRMCQQGFDDALKFLQRNQLISCTRCLSVTSTFQLSQTVEETLRHDLECTDCKVQRQVALLDSLPETVTSILQEAIDSANKGLVNWVFRHRGSSLISVLALPYVLPRDIAHATFLRFCDAIPKLTGDFAQLALSLVKFIVAVIKKMNDKREQFSAKFSCQLAITEYREYDMPGAINFIRNKYNFDFTFDLNNGGLPHSQSEALSLNTQAAEDYLQHHYQPLHAIQEDGQGEKPLAESHHDDTFEQILEVTSHQDAVMAYYYLDSKNQVKVKEIFDVTDADTSAILAPEERVQNADLQFDSFIEGEKYESSCNWQLAGDPDEAYLDTFQMDASDFTKEMNVNERGSPSDHEASYMIFES